MIQGNGFGWSFIVPRRPATARYPPEPSTWIWPAKSSLGPSPWERCPGCNRWGETREASPPAAPPPRFGEPGPPAGSTAGEFLRGCCVSPVCDGKVNSDDDTAIIAVWREHAMFLRYTTRWLPLILLAAACVVLVGSRRLRPRAEASPIGIREATVVPAAMSKHHTVVMPSIDWKHGQPWPGQWLKYSVDSVLSNGLTIEVTQGVIDCCHERRRQARLRHPWHSLCRW